MSLLIPKLLFHTQRDRIVWEEAEQCENSTYREREWLARLIGEQKDTVSKCDVILEDGVPAVKKT